MRYISNSELSTWRRCKRQHWLEYQRKLGPKAKPSLLSTAERGTAVHEGLEAYYGGMPADAVTCDLTDQRDSFDPEEQEEEYDAADKALAVWEAYVNWLAEEGADHGLTPIRAEGEYGRQLTDDVTLIAKLDLLADVEHVPTIIDHKTTKQALAAFIKTLQNRTQFVHYVWVMQAHYPGLRAVVINILRQSAFTAQGTGPYFARKPVPVNTKQLASYEEHAREWVAEILAAEGRTTVPPPSPGSDCHWICPIAKICKSFDDGGDPESVLALEFEVKDPMERYTQEKARSDD